MTPGDPRIEKIMKNINRYHLISYLLISVFFMSVIFITNAESYKAGQNDSRLYEYGYGEFFTMKDESWIEYIQFDLLFDNVIFVEHDNLTFNYKNTRFDNFEMSMLYYLSEQSAENFGEPYKTYEIADYKCTSLKIKSSTNKTGNILFWFWDSDYEIILSSYKINIGFGLPEVFDFLPFLTYSNNNHLRNVIIEGVFFPA